MSRHKKFSPNFGWQPATSDISRQSSPVTQDGGWPKLPDPFFEPPGDFGGGFAAPRSRRQLDPGWGVSDHVADSPTHSVSHSSPWDAELTPPESGSASGVRLHVPSHYPSHVGWGSVESTPVLPAQSGQHRILTDVPSSPTVPEDFSSAQSAAGWIGHKPGSEWIDQGPSAEQLEEERRETLIAGVLRALEQKYDITPKVELQKPMMGQKDRVPEAVNIERRRQNMFRDSNLGPPPEVIQPGARQNPSISSTLRTRERTSLSDSNSVCKYSEVTVLTPTPTPPEPSAIGWTCCRKTRANPRNGNGNVSKNHEKILSIAKHLDEAKGLTVSMLKDPHDKTADADIDAIPTLLKDAVNELKHLNRTNKVLAEIVEKTAIPNKVLAENPEKTPTPNKVLAEILNKPPISNKVLAEIVEKIPIFNNTVLAEILEQIPMPNKLLAEILEKIRVPLSTPFKVSPDSEAAENAEQNGIATGSSIAHDQGDLHIQHGQDINTGVDPAHYTGALRQVPPIVALELEMASLKQEYFKNLAIRDAEIADMNNEIKRLAETIFSCLDLENQVQIEANNATQEFQKLCKDKDAKISLLEEQQEFLETESEKANQELACSKPSTTFPQHKVGSSAQSVHKSGIPAQGSGKPLFVLRENKVLDHSNDPGPSLPSYPFRFSGDIATPKPNGSDNTLHTAPLLGKPKTNILFGELGTATSNGTPNGGSLFDRPSVHRDPFRFLPASAQITSGDLPGSSITPARGLFGSSITPASGSLNSRLPNDNFWFGSVAAAPKGHKTGGNVLGNTAVSRPSALHIAPECPPGSIFRTVPSPVEWLRHQDSAHIPSVPGALHTDANNKNQVVTVESDEEEI